MSSPRSSLGRGIGCAVAAGLVATCAVLFIGLSSATAADESTIKRGKYIWSTKSTCNRCHGWAGDGRGHPRSPGNAPSLRDVELTREQMREVVACGRPGTAMPYHDRHAYKDDRCYGMVMDDLLEEDRPKLGQKPIRPDEIEAVLDYMEAKVIGKGVVTREDCFDYFGPEAGKCEEMREPTS